MSETMSEPLMPKEPAEDLPSESSVDTRCDTLVIISTKTFWLLSAWAFFVNQYPLFMMMNFKVKHWGRHKGWGGEEGSVRHKFQRAVKHVTLSGQTTKLTHNL